MKYTSKQYATALYDALADKDEKEIVGTINRFILVLKKNNDMVLGKSICKEFALVYDRLDAQDRSNIAVAHDIDTVRTLEQNPRLRDARKTVDVSLLGGVRIRMGDKLIDSSILSRMKKLKKALNIIQI